MTPFDRWMIVLTWATALAAFVLSMIALARR
jgi:hypothetical protein